MTSAVPNPARPHPPARRQRPRRAARRLARRARARLRDRPHVARRLGARPGGLRVRRVARPRQDGRRPPRSRRRGRARAAAPRGRARRAGARPVLRRAGAGRRARGRGRAGAGGGAGLARDRDRRPRARARRARGSSGTSSASARRRARPSSRAPPTRRRPSGSARTSACSSTPRRRWRSWPGGRGPTRRSSPPAASTTARRCSRLRRAARGGAGGGVPALRRLPGSNRPFASKACPVGDVLVRSRAKARVRLRLLLVRRQGGFPPPLRGVLEPGQDAVLAGRRRRSRHRPPRGLPVLGHGGAAADRPPPQRRDVQPRPSQPRADRDARAGDGPLRHRQPPLPGAGADRARRGARRHLRAEHAARHLRVGRGRGDRHRDQDRAPHAPEAQDRLDPQGLPRPHRPRGRDRRRPLLDAVPLRPAGGVRPGPLQRPRRDGGGAARAATSPAW